MSPGFANFLAGIPLPAADGQNEGQYQTIDLEDVQVICSENCQMPRHFKGASVIIYEYGKVSVLTAQHCIWFHFKNITELKYLATPAAIIYESSG